MFGENMMGEKELVVRVFKCADFLFSVCMLDLKHKSALENPTVRRIFNILSKYEETLEMLLDELAQLDEIDDTLYEKIIDEVDNEIKHLLEQVLSLPKNL